MQSYFVGDWVQAQIAFNLCAEMAAGRENGPTQHMIKLLEKTKGISPEDWNGGYDWDFKPTPPEIDFIMEGEEDESEK